MSLYTTKRTSNILEGDFRSIHKGRSMEFEDLKEYTPGDEVHDIDWKSSSRMDTVLVRRYMTDRRHNVMFVCDCGHKMMGDTPAGESKKEIALMTFGILSYIVSRNGSDFAIAYPKKNTTFISGFKAGTDHLERNLYEYEKVVCTDADRSLSQTLKDVINNVHKRMIIILITDMEGLAVLEENAIGSITRDHDLIVLGIEDAMLTGNMAYDLEIGRYERVFFSRNKRLHELEKKDRREQAERVHKIYKQNRVSVVSLKNESEIIEKSIFLFERYRHGDYGYITTANGI